MSIVKSGSGYVNKSKGGKKFSKKPLSHARAVAQLRAIEYSKHKGGK